MRLTVALCAAFFAFHSFAASVTVGCPGGTPGDFTSITAAIGSLDYSNDPHTITVSGTCTESVLVRGRERLVIQGPAMVIGTANNPAFRIRGGHGITLRDLVARGVSAAISAGEGADVTLLGVTAENATSGFALDAFGGASLVLGGVNAADGVTLRGSANGMRCEACVAFFAGWVTIENNTSVGLLIDSGRVETSGQIPPAQGGPTTIRNNFNGVSVTNRGVFEAARINYIQNNAASGILLSDGTAKLVGVTTPGGPAGTILEGNARNAVSALFNSTFSSTGPNTFQNNGAPNVQFRAAISAAHSSMVFLTGGTITGSNGPGISADSLSSVRLNGVTISGNSEEGVRLLHGSLLESIGGNNIPAPSVTCDGTSIVHGDLTGVGAFECEKATKK